MCVIFVCVCVCVCVCACVCVVLFVCYPVCMLSCIGGSRGCAWCMPPYRTQFFHFWQKAPISEVHIPLNGSMPPLWEILDLPLTCMCVVLCICCPVCVLSWMYFALYLCCLVGQGQEGRKKKPNNCRPVSLMSIPHKIMGSPIRDKIMST